MRNNLVFKPPLSPVPGFGTTAGNNLCITAVTHSLNSCQHRMSLHQLQHTASVHSWVCQEIPPLSLPTSLSPPLCVPPLPPLFFTLIVLHNPVLSPSLSLSFTLSPVALHSKRQLSATITEVFFPHGERVVSTILHTADGR